MLIKHIKIVENNFVIITKGKCDSYLLLRLVGNNHKIQFPNKSVINKFHTTFVFSARIIKPWHLYQWRPLQINDSLCFKFSYFPHNGLNNQWCTCEGWLGFPDLLSGQKPWWNWYLNPVVNFGEVRRAQLAKSTLLTSTTVPLGSFQILRSVQMLKREWDAESNGKLPHLSIPSKNAAWIPEFAVVDLPLSRSAALIPEFAVKHLPLGRPHWWWWWILLHGVMGQSKKEVRLSNPS